MMLFPFRRQNLNRGRGGGEEAGLDRKSSGRVAVHLLVDTKAKKRICAATTTTISESNPPATRYELR
nr:hypothetical protein CFP56_50883 [Quercus suber]